MGAPLHPRLPAQPNPNPHNKAVQQFKTSSMPSYYISPLSCNDLHLRPGRAVEPIIIEDVPSSVIDKGLNPQFGNSFISVIPIIEDTETPTKTLVEILAETPAVTLIQIHDETLAKIIA